MITPNKPARYYEWLLDQGATWSGTSPVTHDGFGVLTLTWGEAFNSGVTGIRTAVTESRDVSDAETTVFDIDTPWGSYSHSDPVWESGESRLEMDGAVLTVNEDCTYSLSFDELRWSTKSGGDDWVLRHTFSAETISGSGFDHRHNETRLDSDSALGGILFPEPGTSGGADCGDILTQTDHTYYTQGGVSGGWRWRVGADDDWSYDRVAILPISTPALSCACTATLPDITIAALAQSYHLNLTSLQRNVQTITSPGTYYCDCPTGGTQPVTVYWLDNTFEIRSSYIGAVSIKAPMRAHEKYGKAQCDASTAEDTTDTSTGQAYSEFEEQAEYWFGRSTCEFTDPLDLCPESIDPPPPCTDPWLDNHHCYNLLLIRSSWPSAPPCVSVMGSRPFYDVGYDQAHWRSFVQDGTARVGLAANADLTDWQDFDTGVTADIACVRAGKTTRGYQLLLLSLNAGAVELRAGDRSLVFGSPMTLDSGADTHCTLHWSADRRWWAYWLAGTDIKGAVLDGALNVVSGPFTAISGADAGTGFDLHDSGVTGGARRLGLLYISAGDMVLKTTVDGQTFV